MPILITANFSNSPRPHRTLHPLMSPASKWKAYRTFATTHHAHFFFMLCPIVVIHFSASSPCSTAMLLSMLYVPFVPGLFLIDFFQCVSLLLLLFLLVFFWCVLVLINIQTILFIINQKSHFSSSTSTPSSSFFLSYEQHTPRIPPAISYQAAHLPLSPSLSSVSTVESLVTFCLKFKSFVVALFIIR